MPLAEGSFFAIDAGNAQVTAFKPAEDGNGYILRLRETAGQKGVARLKSPVFPLAAAWRTNGLEDNLTPLAVSANSVAIPLQPRAFSTLRLVFGQAPGAAPKPVPARAPPKK
jgi:alpha-mannosidase